MKNSDKVFPIALLWWVMGVVGFTENHYIIVQGDDAFLGCTTNPDYQLFKGQRLEQAPVRYCPFCNKE